MTYKGAPLMSVNQTWGTPRIFFNYLEERFLFVPDLDAAASSGNAKANFYFTEKDNSLVKQWFGQVWLNPPFGKVLLPQFLKKCNEQIKTEQVERIMVLIPARTDTKWFHEIVCKGATRIYLIKGRFNFESPYAKEGANAPFPSMLVEYTKMARYHNMPEILTLDINKKYRGWNK